MFVEWLYQNFTNGFITPDVKTAYLAGAGKGFGRFHSHLALYALRRRKSGMLFML